MKVTGSDPRTSCQLPAPCLAALHWLRLPPENAACYCLPIKGNEEGKTEMNEGV